MTHTAVRWISSTAWELPFFGLPQEIPWPDGVNPVLANQSPLALDPILDAVEALGEEAPPLWRNFLEAAPLHEQLGDALESRDSETALEALHEIEQLTPGTAFVLFHRAHLARLGGSEDEALRLYQQAANLAPNVPPTWSNIGAIHMLREEAEPAIAAFRRALACDPRDPLALEGLTSLKQLVKLRSANPQTPDSFQYVDLPTFDRMARQRIEGMASAEELIKYAEQLLRDGSAPESGVRAAERAAELKPGDPSIILSLSAAYRHVGQLENSRATLELFTSAWPKEPVGYLQLAQTLHALHDEAGEKAALDRVLELDPNAHPALAARFRVIPGAHDHTVENALSDFGRARNSWMAHLIASAIARERGDGPSALRHTTRAFALAPENEEVLINHASALGDQKEIAQIARAIEPAVASGRYSRRLAWTYGHVLYQLRMPADARRVLQGSMEGADENYRQMVETALDGWSGFVTGCGARLEMHHQGFLARPVLITLPDGDGGVLIAGAQPLPAEASFPWRVSGTEALVALQQGESGHAKPPLGLGFFVVREIKTGGAWRATVDCQIVANPDGTLHFRARQGGVKLPVGWVPRPEE